MKLPVLYTILILAIIAVFLLIFRFSFKPKMNEHFLESASDMYAEAKSRISSAGSEIANAQKKAASMLLDQQKTAARYAQQAANSMADEKKRIAELANKTAEKLLEEQQHASSYAKQQANRLAVEGSNATNFAKQNARATIDALNAARSKL